MWSVCTVFVILFCIALIYFIILLLCQHHINIHLYTFLSLSSYICKSSEPRYVLHDGLCAHCFVVVPVFVLFALLPMILALFVCLHICCFVVVAFTVMLWLYLVLCLTNFHVCAFWLCLPSCLYLLQCCMVYIFIVYVCGCEYLFINFVVVNVCACFCVRLGFAYYVRVCGLCYYSF